MKIELNIDEEKIKELAKIASLNELPNAIYYEAKKQAIEFAVNEIKTKLVEKPYYNGKEALYSEVRDYLYKQIEERIKEVIESKFSEKNIESIVSRHFDKVFTEWTEKKIYERLEAVKKDIFIGSSGELESERQAEDDAHQEEIQRLTT